MSKSAFTFLILTIMALACDQLLSPSVAVLGTAATVAACIFSCLFVAALFVGRRIKFDPIMRQAKP